MPIAFSTTSSAIRSSGCSSVVLSEPAAVPSPLFSSADASGAGGATSFSVPSRAVELVKSFCWTKNHCVFLSGVVTSLGVCWSPSAGNRLLFSAAAGGSAVVSGDTKSPSNTRNRTCRLDSPSTVMVCVLSVSSSGGSYTLSTTNCGSFLFSPMLTVDGRSVSTSGSPSSPTLGTCSLICAAVDGRELMAPVDGRELMLAVLASFTTSRVGRSMIRASQQC